MADTVHPNLALVQRMYECFNKNDMETIRREIFAPDLVWNLPGRHPLAGTKHGADEVLAFFSQLVKGNVQVTLDPAADPNTGVDAFGERHGGGSPSRAWHHDGTGCLRQRNSGQS